MADPFAFLTSSEPTTQSAAPEPSETELAQARADPFTGIFNRELMYPTRREVAEKIQQGVIPSLNFQSSEASKRPWEEVARDLSRRGLNPAAYKEQYQLGAAKTAQEGIGFGENLYRSIPVASSIRGFREAGRYQDAVRRLKAGQATDEDYQEIAHYEEKHVEGPARGLKYLQENVTGGSKIGAQVAQGGVDVLGQAPAMLLEGRLAQTALGAVGGRVGRLMQPVAEGAGWGTRLATVGARQAVTLPLMPTLYLEQAAQANLAAGRDTGDIRGLSAAAIKGYVSNLVLGTMQSGIGEKTLAAAQRIAAKGAIGSGEQQLADLALAGLDHLLPAGWETGKTGERGGVLGHLWAGRYGEAGRDAALHMLTFSLFAGIHELTTARPGESKELPAEWPNVLKDRMAEVRDEQEQFWSKLVARYQRQGYAGPAAGQKAAADVAADARVKMAEVERISPPPQPAAEAPIRQRVDQHTENLRQLDIQVANAKAQVLGLGKIMPPQSSLEYPHWESQLEQATSVLKAWKRQHTGERRRLTAARNELMRQPSETPTPAPTQPPAAPQTVPEGPPVAERLPPTETPPEPVNAPPANAGVSLGPAQASRTMGGERKLTHEIRGADGSVLGTIAVVPRDEGKTLHVDWTGLAGAASGERANELGAGATRMLIRQLAQAYPHSEIVMGLRAGGVFKGQTRGVELSRYRENQPSEAPAATPHPTETDLHRVIAAVPGAGGDPAKAAHALAELGRLHDLHNGDPDKIAAALTANPELARLWGLEPTAADHQELADAQRTDLQRGASPHAVQRDLQRGTQAGIQEADQAASGHEPAANAPQARGAASAGAENRTGATADSGRAARIAAHVERVRATIARDTQTPLLKEDATKRAQDVLDSIPPDEIRDVTQVMTGNRWRGVDEARLKLLHEMTAISKGLEGQEQGWYRGDAPRLEANSAAARRENAQPQPATDAIDTQQATDYVRSLDDVGQWHDTPAALKQQILTAVPDLAAALEGKRGRALADALKDWQTQGPERASAHKAVAEAIPPDEDLERQVDESDLSPRVKAGIKAMLRGDSVRGAGKVAGGYSGEYIRRQARTLFGESVWSKLERQAQDRLVARKERQEALTRPAEPDDSSIQPGDPIPGVTQGAHASDPAAVRQAEEDFAKGRSTAMPNPLEQTNAGPNPLAGIAARVAAHAQAALRWFGGNIRLLAGQQFPRIRRLWQSVADAAAHFTASNEYAYRASEYFKQRILDPLVEDVKAEYARDYPGQEMTGNAAAVKAAATARSYMSAMYEERLRQTRAHHQARNDPEAADKVRTLIGVEGSNLPTEAEYRRILASEGYQRFGQRWGELSNVAEALFRKALDIDPAEPIDSISQLTGRVFHAKALAEGEVPDAGHVVFTSTRGDLSNPKAGKLGSANTFTGSAEGYDLDADRVIEYTLARRVKNANKAALYREIVAQNAGARGRPGQTMRGPDDTKWIEIPNAFTPASTGAPAGTARETSLYVHPDAEPELRRALQVDKPWRALPGSQLVTDAALFSLVEAATHGRNLGTMMFKAAMNPIQAARNFYRVVTNDVATMRKVMDMAADGMMKPHGMESQTGEGGRLWGGPTDPTYWTAKSQRFMGKVLDVIDTTMRLTMNDAFDTLVKRYGAGIEKTEANRRDFINQLGNYQKQTQHAFVAWLRDTGLGPFATAGSTMIVNGVRALTLDPGVRTTNWQTAVKLRAELALRLGAVMSVAALTNYLLWKRVDGDENTPFGAIKLGKGQKTGFYDLLSLTGWNRGARTVGLLATMNSERYGNARGESAGRIANNATKQWWTEDLPHAIVHPAAGPIVQLGWSAFTGKSTTGFPARPPLKPNENEMLANLQGALLNANPVVSVLSGADRPGQRVEWWEKSLKMLGPLAPHFSKTPVGKPHPLH